MTQNQYYQALNPDRIKSITNSIEIGYQLIVVTLISGDELLGALAKHWNWDGREIDISFNTSEGKRFSLSHVVHIPIDQIANITSIPLADESLPMVSQEMDQTSAQRLFVQDYPNPLATIIENHNLQVCKLYGFKVGNSVEMSLSRASIPSEGIKLKEDCMFYADWEFFSHQMNSALTLTANIGPLSLAKEVNPSFQAYVFKHLKENFVKIQKLQDILEPVGISEIFVQGCILMPEPAQDTDIEGENCILVYCANTKNNGETAYPVLFKRKSLKFPLEFLGQVSSSLVFYGELLPIPLEVYGIHHSHTILARAIGYLHSQ